MPSAIEWTNGELFLLDQTVLPHQVVMQKQQCAKDIWQSIKVLKVRGAPAIGVAAAFGLCISVKDKRDLN